MNSSCIGSLATVGVPLFGSVWLALGLIMSLIAIFVLAVAALGRWLAATHPEPVKPVPVAVASVPAADSDSDELTDEVLVVIAAAVQAELGSNARVTSVKPAQVSVEALMQHWSLEGRRQIYSSHRVR